MLLKSRILQILVFVALSTSVALADENDVASASKLMDSGLYTEAAKGLMKAVERQGDDASAAELRMLGECYYQIKDFANARTYYTRALPRQTSQKGKIVCESRLAIVNYRLGDMSGAEERITDFIRKYPEDERVGTLSAIRLRIIQDSGLPRAEKIAKMQEMYDRMIVDKEKTGYYNVVLAAQALGGLYIEAGAEDRAAALFVTAVHQMRSLIAAEKAKKLEPSPDLKQGADGMSLQLAKMYMGQKNWAEAQKWLENVSYNEDMVAQAKYLLAQIYYRNKNYVDAGYMLSDDVLSKVPDGETKYSMYLLAAVCHREMKPPNLERAKDCLKQIPATSASYAQAQCELGNIYRDQKDMEHAEEHYLAAVKDPQFEPMARFNLGAIAKERGDAIKGMADADKKRREGFYKKAGENLQVLMQKYPITDLAKQAKSLVTALQNQGVVVVTESSDEERIAAWEKQIKEKPNSYEAGQAMLAMAQNYARTVLDPRTRVVTKAPNWEASAQAVMPLVQSQTAYAGLTPERWREMRRRALYMLARAELGSLPPAASSRRLRAQVEPTRLAAGGSTERALKYLAEAQSLLPDQGAGDDARDIEYATIEAMLKSEDKAVREKGEKRYADREPRYGNDPVFQQLAVITADWLDDHGFHELAARTYRTVARKTNMDRDNVQQLLRLAGMSYGRGGRLLIENRDKSASIAFQLQPRSVIKTGTGNPALKAPVFQLTKRILWEQEGPDLSAAAALTRVSREFEVPFVWSPEEAPGSIATYLKQTIIPRAKLKTWREAASLSKILGDILDMTQCDVDFDLGVSGGAPTFKPKGDAGPGTVENPTIEIFMRNRERFAALARPYGSFASVHGNSTMLFGIFKRVEELTGGRMIWGEGVQKDEVLSAEFRQIPSVPVNENTTCRNVLDQIMPAVGLQYKVVAQDNGREMIQESIKCFDELRRFGADSLYAEDATFNIAVNLYILKDYGKMMLLLREYLKTYDNPSFAHYYDVCFWLGRLFEIEHKYREAVKYYSMAAEEKVVLYRPAVGAPLPSLDDVKKRLSSDTLVSLSRKVSGIFTNVSLQTGFRTFVRSRTNIELSLDPSAQTIELPIDKPEFVGVPCIDLIYDVMVALGLDLRTENGDKDAAEKAYYRLAVVYKEDSLMREALENLQTLLTRFPNTPRTVDALNLKLEILKGLRDYDQVLATLDQLQVVAAGKIEERKLDYERGRIYFDLCSYTNAETYFAKALSASKDTDEWVLMREAMAQTCLRQSGRERDALTYYRDNRQYETSALRQSIYAMMIHWLEYAISQPPRTRKSLPPQEAEFIALYEKLTDAQRAEMGQGELARATWIYYALAMEDMVDGKSDAALTKLDAASESPDNALAGEALYQSALIYQGKGDIPKAKECLEQLLFTTRTVEPIVKATYELARCLKALNDNDGAFARMREVVARYGASPYAERIRQDPFYQQRVPAPATTNAPPAGAATSISRPAAISAGSTITNAGGIQRP